MWWVWTERNGAIFHDWGEAVYLEGEWGGFIESFDTLSLFYKVLILVYFT